MNGQATLERLDAALGPSVAQRILEHRGQFAGAIGRWRHGGAQVDFDGAQTLQLLFNISGGQKVLLEGDGQVLSPPVRAGSVTIIDPAEITKVRISGEADTLQMVLSRSWVAAARSRPSDPPVALVERQRRIQALAARSLLVLADEASGEAQILPILQEAVALAAQRPPVLVLHKGGLRPRARRRVLALLEARLAQGRPAAVAELADMAGLSPYHFIRAFHASEGRTPHAWLLARRIDEALRRLLEENSRVDTLADAVGFSSPAHFVSSFRHSIGVTPARLREAALRLRGSGVSEHRSYSIPGRSLAWLTSGRLEGITHEHRQMDRRYRRRLRFRRVPL